MPKLLEYRYEQIVSDYLSGMTQKSVADKNGITRCAVSEIVRARGIDTRSYTGERTFCSNRKWMWDFSFFDKRNPIVAYWAGFLMADGSLNTDNNGAVLVFVLQEKDREYVLSFCDSIGVSRDAVSERKNYDRRCFGINLSYHGLPNQLKYWGIIPRKTFDYIEPQVDIELLPHYLRGWADGDGSIYAYGRSARFTVVGNNLALEWYIKSLRLLGFEGHIGLHPLPGSTIHSNLYIGGQNQVNRIRELLLVDNSFKMDRKWNTFRA